MLTSDFKLSPAEGIVFVKKISWQMTWVAECNRRASMNRRKCTKKLQFGREWEREERLWRKKEGTERGWHNDMWVGSNDFEEQEFLMNNLICIIWCKFSSSNLQQYLLNTKFYFVWIMEKGWFLHMGSALQNAVITINWTLIEAEAKICAWAHKPLVICRDLGKSLRLYKSYRRGVWIIYFPE